MSSQKNFFPSRWANRVEEFFQLEAGQACAIRLADFKACCPQPIDELLSDGGAWPKFIDIYSDGSLLFYSRGDLWEVYCCHGDYVDQNFDDLTGFWWGERGDETYDVVDDDDEKCLFKFCDMEKQILIEYFQGDEEKALDFFLSKGGILPDYSERDEHLNLSPAQNKAQS